MHGPRRQPRRGAEAAGRDREERRLYLHPNQGEDRRPRGVSLKNWYDDYRAAAWNEGPYSYTQRGWCRVEMFFAANIPVIDDRSRAERCFQHGFKVHVLNGVRPHLLYGTGESKRLQPPKILPPMQNSLYDKLDPLKGKLTVPSDRAKIEELYENLRPYFKKRLEGGV